MMLQSLRQDANGSARHVFAPMEDRNRNATLVQEATPILMGLEETDIAEAVQAAARSVVRDVGVCQTPAWPH
jgi:hypothetical protein